MLIHCSKPSKARTSSLASALESPRGGREHARVPASPRRQLLSRIEDELALAAAVPELPPPLAMRAVAVMEGPGGALADRLRPARHDSVSDRALHAIAALEHARFDVLVAGSDERATETSARALAAAWSALGQRTAYLAEVAAPILGASASAAGAVTSAIGIDRVIDALMERARTGGDLGGLLRGLAAAGAPGTDTARRAARARLDALDLVIDPLRRTLDELATRRPSVDEVVAAFAAVRAAWRRCDRDMELEVLAVERLADFAWDLYRERKLSELARVLEEVTEPASSLASRIELGLEAIAWAAPCAQVLVFRAELAPRFDAQVELAQRAHVVCPTLRNARLVLGDFLLTRAERAIDRNADVTTAGTKPEDDVSRAAELHPDLKRLPAIREKLAKRRA
jgi:hypothetical protein